MKKICVGRPSPESEIFENILCYNIVSVCKIQGLSGKMESL